MRRFLLCTTALGAFFAASTATSPVEAGGLSTARFGGELGHVVGDNPGAIYYNPGAIGLTRGFNIMVDGLLAWRTASFDRRELCPSTANPESCGDNRFSEPADGIGANYSKSKLANFIAAPMLGATGRIPLSDDIALGVGAGFFVPFGGQSTWGNNTAFEGSNYPGAVAGSQRWWAIDGTLRSLFISAAASVSISELVHVGMSGGVAINQVNTLRAKALDNSDNLNAEGRAWLNAKDMNAHLGAGIVVTPWKNNDLRLGFSYQAPVGFNGVTMNGTLTIHDGAGQVTEQNVDFHHVWPDIFNLGVAWLPIEELELRFNGNVQRWSLLKDQCITNAGAACEIQESGAEPEGRDDTIVNIPRRWQDTVGFRVGASYWVAPEVELFGGVGYDGNAVPDATMEPALTDFHDIAVNLGAKFGLGDHVALAASYTQVIYFARDVDSSLNVLEGDSMGPAASGKYTQNLGYGNINVIFNIDPWSDDSPTDSGEPEGPMPVEGDFEAEGTMDSETMVEPDPIAPIEPEPPMDPIEPAPDDAGPDGAVPDAAPDAAPDDAPAAPEETP